MVTSIVRNGARSIRHGLASQAACGFANATGGVIVIGMEAKAGPDGVDVVKSEKPVDDANTVRPQVEDAISKIVKPGIEGVRSRFGLPHRETLPLSQRQMPPIRNSRHSGKSDKRTAVEIA